MTVLAVRSDDGILLGQCRHHARRNRFLADVQVQEAADLAGAVDLGALLLEAPDADHLAQQSDRGVARQLHVKPRSRESRYRPRAGRARAPSTAGA
jgi:hypothetical protein